MSLQLLLDAILELSSLSQVDKGDIAAAMAVPYEGHTALVGRGFIRGRGLWGSRGVGTRCGEVWFCACAGEI